MRSLLTVWMLALSVQLVSADIQSSPGSPKTGARSALPVVTTTPRPATTATAPRPGSRVAPPTAKPGETQMKVMPRAQHNARGAYPWRYNITATVFWVGEDATVNNPVHNHKSSWDGSWKQNFGGFDDPNPDNRVKGPHDYRPKSFVPRQNPFYIALPYNDVSRGSHKDEAMRVIPWFRRDFCGKGQSVCKGKWVQITYNGRHCFAQWEDCGPFTTEDWKYVFGDDLPVNKSNKNAGIDISPAVRDFLGIKGGTATVHWRFVDFERIPRGPWALYGENNPFVHAHQRPEVKARLARAEAWKKKLTVQQRKTLAANPR